MKMVDRSTDPWRDAVDEPIGAKPWQVVPADAWHVLHDRWPADVPVAIWLGNDADPATLSGRLDRVAMVSLAFPKWTDGRAYSQARLLRVRVRFRGEIRATGDVIADMLPLLVRTGFDAAVLRPDQREDTALRALARFGAGHYQGDVPEPRPRFSR
jgi:uncharacterized protein (DUF934 family)